MARVLRFLREGLLHAPRADHPHVVTCASCSWGEGVYSLSARLPPLMRS